MTGGKAGSGWLWAAVLSLQHLYDKTVRSEFPGGLLASLGMILTKEAGLSHNIKIFLKKAVKLRGNVIQ